MSKVDEILIEVDGKISFAETTGNIEAKEELLEIRNALMELKNSKEGGSDAKV